MNYICLKEKSFSEPPYTITSIRQDDMLLIRQWRNEQIAILRQKASLSVEEQQAYWVKEVEPSFKEQHPRQILFSFLHAGKCIGYGGLTHIDWDAKRAEVSFLLQTERGEHPQLYKKDFTHFLNLLKKVAFQDLNFHRLFTETFDIRPLHVRVLESVGFREEGRLKDHVIIEGRYVDSIIHGLVNK